MQKQASGEEGSFFFNLFSALLESWIKTRLSSLRSRAENELRKLQEQQHTLEGYAKAEKLTDEIILLLQKSADSQEASKALTREQL